MAITTDKELGEALKNNAESIEIEGDLVNKVIRLKATGKTAWFVAIGAIGVAVGAAIVLPMTSGASGVAGLAATPAAVAVWGVPTTISAISVAIAAGGIGGLAKIRKYRLLNNANGSITLKRS